MSVPLLRKDRPEAEQPDDRCGPGVRVRRRRGLACRCCPAPRSSSCRRMPLSDAAFGCPPTRPRSTPRVSGLAASEHALLGAVVELPELGRRGADRPAFLGVAGLAGRSRRRRRGHLPGCGLCRAGDPRRRRGRLPVVDELMLAAPLVIPATGSVSVQVVVGGADESGNRAVSMLFARRRALGLDSARRRRRATRRRRGGR